MGIQYNLPTMKMNPHELTPDFNSAAFQHELYTHYGNYLREAPVFRSDEGVVYLARHADCVALLSNDSFRRTPPSGGCSPFSEEKREPSPLEIMISHWMIFMDPPRHGIVRKAFMPLFTAKSVKQCEPLIQRITAQLIADLPEDGQVDFLKSFAFPLPIMVIAEILGVPQHDMEQFRIWSWQMTLALDKGDEEDIKNGASASIALGDYFRDMIRKRHTLPPHSLLHTLSADDAGGLSEDELLYGCAFLLLAGHETVKALLSSGMLTLAQRGDDLASVQTHPELMDSMVEEMLRYESPFQKFSRWAHADFMFGDYLVPQGTLVSTLIGAANRDPAVFSDPNQFDIRRSRNRHIAFGTGIHHCLGAAFARSEARIAFGMLLPRLRQLELVSYQWRTYSALRSLESLHISIGKV